jgi:WD40 repeat protein
MEHSAVVNGVTFSPNGQLLATSSADTTIKLWHWDGDGHVSPHSHQTLAGHNALVVNVAFSPDSQILASASWDTTVNLWNREGTLLTTLLGHSAPVWKVAISPDGQFLASVSEDNMLILWDLPRILKLDLLEYACDWVRDYLRTNADVEESDRHLCDCINTSQ